ncbi:hypothetical protein D3C87_1743460 [compost metagenome]
MAPTLWPLRLGMSWISSLRSLTQMRKACTLYGEVKSTIFARSGVLARLLITVSYLWVLMLSTKLVNLSATNSTLGMPMRLKISRATATS